MAADSRVVTEIRVSTFATMDAVFDYALETGRSPGPEYFVIEQWDDDTYRHPTTGRRVAGVVWRTNKQFACDFLRGLID